MITEHPADHVAASILEAVGDTPIVELSRLTRGLPGRLLAKCEYLPQIHCYVVEPRGVEVLAGCLVTCSRHVLQGAGYARAELRLVHREHIDGFLAVADGEATEMTRQLARVEGIFGGYTAGANVAAGLQLLRGEFAGRTVVISIPDSGMKYFSTGLWD